MSLAAKNSERVKYQRLFELAHEQVRALSEEKFEEFDRIVAEKSAVVGTLIDARTVVSEDPVIAKMVEQIQLCDKSAQRLLYTSVGRIIRELSGLQQFDQAKRYYAKSNTPKRISPLVHATGASRFFDEKS